MDTITEYICEPHRVTVGFSIKEGGTMANEITEEVEKVEEAKEIKIDLKVDKKKAEEAMKTLKDAFSGVSKTVDKISGGIKKAMGSMTKEVKSYLGDVGDAMTKAFTVTNMEEYAAAAERFGEGVAGSLLSMNENMAALETSIVDSVAPIAGVVVPIINDAVLAVTDLVDGMGQVIAALFGGATGTDAFAQSTEGVAGIVAPLQAIDLSAAATAFSNLQAAIEPLTQDLFAGLEWAYTELFVPLAEWTTEGVLPSFLDLVSGAIRALDETLAAVQPLATWLWDNFLQPIAEWTGGAIVTTLQWLADKLTAISTWISENQALVEGFAIVVGSVAAAIALVNAATGIWEVVSAAATAVTWAFGVAINFLTSPIGLVIVAIAAVIAIIVLLVQNWDTVKEAVLSAWDAVMEALGNAGEWLKKTVLDPIVNGFKGMVNGVIGFINWLIEGAVKGINGVIGLLNKLQFTVPDWVPGLGGKTLGFNLKLLSAPQIPYLAKGAVLPANRPFLAVVGDQRHGTNVEAPLATIQEAVALVLEDHIGAMMAGFEALLKEQQATRRTIEGIEIGDTVIGRAAERYGRKMAVVRGGY